MQITCKNCSSQFNGNYCSNCGQIADTGKIDYKFIFRQVKDIVFVYAQSGILYTTRHLLNKPGTAILEYVQGKRVNHFKPIPLLLLLSGLFALLYNKFDINFWSAQPGQQILNSNFTYQDINSWMSAHFSFETILLLPFYTLASFFVFRQQGFNLPEHFILNTFAASQRMIWHIFTFPLLYIFNGTAQMTLITKSFLVMDFIILFWTYSQFFNKLSIVKSFLLTLLSYAIFFFSFTAVAVFLIYIYKYTFL